MNESIISGKKLYELRCSRNLTLQQAADRIGIHKSTLCRYEYNEEPRIRPEVMERIREVYQADLSRMGREEEKQDSGWYRILTSEEVSRAYDRLSEREKLRVSRLLGSQHILS